MSTNEKWVYQVVAALSLYEDLHGHPNDGAVCMQKALDIVPDDVKTVARAMVDLKLDDHHGFLYETGE